MIFISLHDFYHLLSRHVQLATLQFTWVWFYYLYHNNQITVFDSIDIYIYKLLLTYVLLIGSGNILSHIHKYCVNVDWVVVEVWCHVALNIFSKSDLICGDIMLQLTFITAPPPIKGCPIFFTSLHLRVLISFTPSPKPSANRPSGNKDGSLTLSPFKGVLYCLQWRWLS